MKIRNETFADLKAAIDAFLPESERQDAKEAYANADRSPMRFRWDVLHGSRFGTSRLYAEGLDDNHIDTALRRIIG